MLGSILGGLAAGVGSGLLGGLFGGDDNRITGSAGGGPSVRTEEGQKLLDQFMSIYGSGGVWDPKGQATQYDTRMNDLYNRGVGLFEDSGNLSPITLKMNGMSIPTYGTARKNLALRSGLLDRTGAYADQKMKRSYDPFVNMTQGLESLRYGQAMPSSPGLTGQLAQGLGMAGLLQNMLPQIIDPNASMQTPYSSDVSWDEANTADYWDF